MTYVFQYHESVKKFDFQKLGLFEKERIKRAINGKLVDRPEIFGKPLRSALRGYRSLRVGGYRVIFRIENNVVKIFAIMRRDVVYKEACKRLKVIVV